MSNRIEELALTEFVNALTHGEEFMQAEKEMKIAERHLREVKNRFDGHLNAIVKLGYGWESIRQLLTQEQRELASKTTMSKALLDKERSSCP